MATKDKLVNLEDLKVVGDAVGDLKSHVGTLSQLHTDDKTSLVNAVNEVNDYLEDGIANAVDSWLDDHPEATTTVQDHSLTYEKMVNGTLGFVRPEMYGAVGDGVTNDTSALQACIVSGNNVLLTGTYLITSPIDFADKNNITVCGGKIVRSSNQTFNTFVGDNCDNIHVHDVEFDGNGNIRSTTYTWPDNVQACMIFASQAKNITIENCKIKNYNYGISILGADVENSSTTFSNTSMNGVIRNCVFYNCDSGIDTYGKRLLIDNNTFYQSTGISVQIEPNLTASAQDNPMDDTNYYQSALGTTISNNLFIDGSSDDVRIHPNSYGIQIYSNVFLNFYKAIVLNTYGGSKGVHVYDNVLIYQKAQTISDSTRPWSYKPAIECQGDSHKLIENNSLYSVVVGILTQGCTSIVNNYINKPQISGIVEYDSSSAENGISIIRGNTIVGHTVVTGAWWACYAVVVGESKSTIYILDTIVNSTARPLFMMTNTTAIVKSLLSNVESSAITKPTGGYDYSN